MSRALLEQSHNAPDMLSRSLDLSEDMRYSIAAIGGARTSLESSACPMLSAARPYTTSSESRLLDHCLIYTRCYAILENFVFQRLVTILGFFERNVSFSDLSQEVRGAFRRGTSDLLSRLGQDRYSRFSEAGLVSNYAVALGQIEGEYALTPEAILRNEQNYRLDEISRLFALCGVPGIKDWVGSHKDVQNFFHMESRQSDTADAYLRSLVDYRNSAAHGFVDNISSTKLLREAIAFTKLVVDVLYERSRIFLLSLYVKYGELSYSGEVTESFSNNAVVALWKDGELCIGEIIAVGTQDRLSLSKIEGMQLDGIAIERVRGSEHLELGIKFDCRVKRKKRLWRFSPDADVGSL